MGTDPAGTDMQSYLHDVGQVFLGYGDVVNPVNWAKGAWGAGADLYGHTMDNWNAGMGLTSFQAAQVQTGGDMASGLWSTLTDWSTPRAFGNSWMSWSTILAPEMAKIPNPLAYGLDAYRLDQGGATLLNVSKNGESIFRIDAHRLPNKGFIEQSARGKLRLHYHRGVKGVRNSIDVHRPYQHVRGQPRW